MQQTPKEHARRIVVIGGGISGLAAAHRLLELRARDQLSLEIMLLEASARLGGTIMTHRRDGFLLEAGPDSFISEKPEAVALAKRIGLSEHLIETNPAYRRSFVVRGGRLHPTPEGFQLLAPSRFLPFATSKIFSWRGKARMALDLLLPRATNAGPGEALADESLAHFVRRRFGQEALERIAQPMVGGIYTADPELLSLRATMPRFLEMERKHRSIIRAMWKAARQQKANGSPSSKPSGPSASGARYSLFLSLAEGMQTLTDALAARLPPGTARVQARVESLAWASESGRWLIGFNDAQGRPETMEAEAVCLALPAYAAAHLLRPVDATLAGELDAIPYASTATVNLAFNRADIPHPLDGFGYVSPFIEQHTTLACSFSSVKFAGRAPANGALLRAFVGGALQPAMFALEENAMLEAVQRDLSTLLGIARPPLFASVQKWSRSMPQYHLGHLARLARLQERLRSYPRLQLAGNAYHGAGIPDCIRSGESAAHEIVKSLAT